jgi:radical SAM/Cys-rich protein
MNAFEKALDKNWSYPLRAEKIETLVANMGYKCSLRCSHCYIDASPERTEILPLSTIDKLLDIFRTNTEIKAMHLTGGSVELHPHFRYFVQSAAATGKKVLIASNLTAYSEPGMEDLPQFLAEHRVTILASLPCVTEETVDKQRGKGTYKKCITALKMLNAVGYGKDGSSLELDLIFNPIGAYLAPDADKLEQVFKEKLREIHGINFNHLYKLNNVPIGRMKRSLSAEEENKYMDELESKFNPATVDTLMCRSSVAVDCKTGRFFDCDFAIEQKRQIKSELSRIDDFNYTALCNREISTSPICFACTAGSGLECCAAKL